MTQKQIISKLEEKKARLEEIVNYQCSKTSGEHDRIISNAKSYLKDIKYLIATLQLIKKEIYIVSESTLDSKMKKADFSSIEEEGQFFKMGFIQNFPYKDIYLLYLAPLTSI